MPKIGKPAAAHVYETVHCGECQFFEISVNRRIEDVLYFTGGLIRTGGFGDPLRARRFLSATRRVTSSSQALAMASGVSTGGPSRLRIKR